MNRHGISLDPDRERSSSGPLGRNAHSLTSGRPNGHAVNRAGPEKGGLVAGHTIVPGNEPARGGINQAGLDYSHPAGRSSRRDCTKSGIWRTAVARPCFPHGNITIIPLKRQNGARVRLLFCIIANSSWGHGGTEQNRSSPPMPQQTKTPPAGAEGAWLLNHTGQGRAGQIPASTGPCTAWKARWSPSRSTRTTAPSRTSPPRIFSASGSCTSFWIVRFSGRAP